MSGLFDRALASEKSELLALHKAWIEAKEATAAHKTERERLQNARYKVDAVAPLNARAAFLGEKVTAAKGPSAAELDLKIKGAAAVIADDEHAEAVAHGAMQARMIEVVKACTDRVAQGYLAHALRLAADHAELGAATEFVAALTDVKGALTDPEEWAKLYVPSSQLIPSLRGRGVEINPHWHTYALAGGDPSGERKTITDQAAFRAVDALEAELRNLFGGTWPFKRSASGGASPDYYATARKEVPSTRRAVLEKAADRIMP
jgi:hypothetical protein